MPPSNDGIPDDYGADGYNRYGFSRDGYGRDGFSILGYNRDGFSRDGYGRDGFNRDGYDRAGYDREGYDRDGYDLDGFNTSGYDRAGYNLSGYNRDGYDLNGYNASGYDSGGYNSEGYDRGGYGRDGYNRDGWNRSGYNRSGFNWYGYNSEGYDRNGYNRNGYDRNGYNLSGFNSRGYDQLGYSRSGYNSSGYDRSGYDRSGYDQSGYNRNGYDALGYNRNGYDSGGYDSGGYDSGGYDADGYDAGGYDADGNHRPLVDTSDLDLPELWTTFWSARNQSQARKRDAFLAYLRRIASTPEDIDDVGFCATCADPDWTEDMSTSGLGDSLCQDCYSDLDECALCERRFPGINLTTLLDDTSACDSCRGDSCSYCETCDGYYHDEDSDEHEHRSSSCCESPQWEFTIVRNGDEPLRNDTRATVTLPSGVISPEGLNAIRTCLRQQGPYLDSVRYDLATIGDQWQAPEGTYTKRLSHRAYKEFGVKIPPEVLSQVGCIARDHSKPADVSVEVTRDLNLSSQEFGNDGSCWWGGYSESRCALKTNGGLGLRTFDDYDDVTGRIWVMPLKQAENERLLPTFNTMAPSAFVLFNGYGDLSGYTGPRIMAHLSGWTYRKIGFGCNPMYVNNGMGYLVAPEPLAARYASASLNISVSQHGRLFYVEQAAEKKKNEGNATDV